MARIHRGQEGWMAIIKEVEGLSVARRQEILKGYGANDSQYYAARKRYMSRTTSGKSVTAKTTPTFREFVPVDTDRVEVELIPSGMKFRIGVADLTKLMTNNNQG